jgi:hypothetical protein
MEAKRKAQLRKDEEKAKCLNELGTLVERKNPCRKNHEPATLLDMLTPLPCGSRQKSHGLDIFDLRDIPEDRAECSGGVTIVRGGKKEAPLIRKKVWWRRLRPNWLS